MAVAAAMTRLNKGRQVGKQVRFVEDRGSLHAVHAPGTNDCGMRRWRRMGMGLREGGAAAATLTPSLPPRAIAPVTPPQSQAWG